MHLEVKRKTFTSQSTCGELWIDDTFVCYTLEPRKEQSKGKPFCIPAGTYIITLGWSKARAMNVPHVNNVPGFSEIEIHWGNYPKDTEGCLLVGRTIMPDFVGNSKKTFDGLLTKLTYPASISYSDGN